MCERVCVCVFYLTHFVTNGVTRFFCFFSYRVARRSRADSELSPAAAPRETLYAVTSYGDAVAAQRRQVVLAAGSDGAVRVFEQLAAPEAVVDDVCAGWGT